MSESKLDTQFQSQGSLVPPGPVGRLVRLGWGVVCAYGVWSIATTTQYHTGYQIPSAWTWWATTVLLLVVTPYVVNIGLGVSWRAWPRYAVGLWIAAGVAVSWALTGAFWSPALGWSVAGWQLLTLGWLGFSFLLSTVIGTPGCEMRAISHLWSLITGRARREHYCPGHLDNVDRWEARGGSS